MRKLATVLSIFAMMTMCLAAYAEEQPIEPDELAEETADIQEYVPYDPNNDPTRINPSPLDEIIRRQNQQNYNRLEADTETSDYDDSHEDQPKARKAQPSTQKSQRTRQKSTPQQNAGTSSGSNNPFTQDNNSIQFRNNSTRPSYSGNRQTQQRNSAKSRAVQEQSKNKNARRWQTWDDVKDTWHDKKAAYQFTNWTFTPDEVTVQLVDRKGKAVRTYTIYPLEDGNPDAGYELGEPVKAGTQIVVPDGCTVQGDFRHVNRNEDPAVFGTGEVMYFKSDDRGAGFIIFPYDHGRWRYQIGLR